MPRSHLQYVTDEKGQCSAVIVPIKLWKEIESHQETAYLLKSSVMKQRLQTAKNRQGGFNLEEVREKLGV